MAVSSPAIARVPLPSVLDRLPPAALVMMAVIGFQLGAVVAKPAIEAAGPLHTGFLRTALGAAMLLAWQRPKLPIARRELLLIIAAGATMMGNTLLMYAAIELIPVGIAVAIGFWGPIALALHGSRRPIDFVWVGLAIAGILLFTPLADASFDTTGVIYAVIAGGGFAATLVFASQLGRRIGGVPAAGLAMGAGGLVIAPFSLASGLHDHFETDFLVRMLLAAVLISIFGFAVEYTALTRIRPSLYSILISLEPAVGAVLGFLLLSETIGWLGAAGIGAVAAASIGASRTQSRDVSRET